MSDFIQMIGNTSLVKLEKLSTETGFEVLMKYEASNPGGSIKDRAVRSMVVRAEQKGIIEPGKSTLIEPTSGNTGIALAMIGAIRGYNVVIVMPESMSEERKSLIKQYGARLELTSASGGMAEAVTRAEHIASNTEGSWIVGQFTNSDNPLAHEEGTAPEIERALGEVPDYVVSGVGTGGTLSGIAHYFGKSHAKTRFYAVEPQESPLISQALKGQQLTPGKHGIQGIGANFIPKNLDLAVIEGAISVSTEEATKEARWLAAEEGILVGISSGANIAAVRKFAHAHPEHRGSTIVTFGVDTGERYISTPLFSRT